MSDFDDFMNQTGKPSADFYSTAMQHESAGQNVPNAAGGAAFGYYQFMPGTWEATRVSHPELSLPADIHTASKAQQTAAYHAFATDNAKQLAAAGIPVNDKNVFMASFMGAGGATKFLKAYGQNPNANAAEMFPAEAASNPTVFYQNGKPASLANVYATMTGKFGGGNTTGVAPSAAPGDFDDFMTKTAPGAETQPAIKTSLTEIPIGTPAPTLPVGGGVHTIPPAVAAKQAAINATVLAQLAQTGDQGNAKALGWGPGLEAANSATLGYSAPIMGAGSALKTLASGGSPADASEAYDQTLRAATLARHGYEAANPWSATGASIVGGLPAMMAGGAALEAGLGGVAALGPTAALGARFLGGTAGETLTNPVARAAATWGSRAASGATQALGADYLTSSPGEEHPLADVTIGPAANLLLGGAGRGLAAAGINPQTAQVGRDYLDTMSRNGLDADLYGHNLTTDKGLAKAGTQAVGSEAQTAQLKQFSQGVARTFGADQIMRLHDIDVLTPEVMADTERAIGNQFNQIASRTIIPWNVGLAGGLNAIGQAAQGIPYAESRNAVAYALDRIRTEAARNGGAIDGAMYQSFTKSDASLVRGLTSNPNTRAAGMQIKNLLDSQLEQYAPQDLKGAMAATRQQWKNMKIAEDALDQSETGLIDPQRYARQVKSANDNYGQVDPVVQSLGSAGGTLNFAKPSKVGGTTGAATSEGFFNKHGALGGGMLGAMAGQGLEHAGGILSHLSGTPILGSGVVPALGAAGVGAAGGMMRAGLRKRALASPDWAKAMLYGPQMLDMGVGAAPIGAQMARPFDWWQQNDQK